MIICMGEARFGAGELDRLKAVFAATIAATRAEEGCEHYSYAIDVGDPNLLRVAELWRDQAALDAHMASPHMAALMGALGTAKLEALRIDTYDARFLKNLLGG